MQYRNLTCVSRGLSVALMAVLAPCGMTAELQPRPQLSGVGRWAIEQLSVDAPQPSFSFVYDGRPSVELLRGWPVEKRTLRLDDHRTSLHLIYTDPATSLEVRCEAVVYDDFPAVEWVVYLRNRGSNDTPIIENLQALDVPTSIGSDDVVTLHYSRGGIWDEKAFEPLVRPLTAGAAVDLSTVRQESAGPRDFAGGAGGLSSNPYLPFFNMAHGDGGVIVALGWSGNWAAQFQRSAPDQVLLRAGMQRTHLRLHPGEEIRTPLVLLLSWQGQVIDGQNLFRRMVLAHYTPLRPKDWLWSSASTDSWGAQNVADQMAKIRLIDQHDLPINCYWIDGGWAEGNKPDSFGEWSKNVGNWGDSAEVYPAGVAAISSAVHAAGMKFVLWFEPTRVYEGTRIYREHPQWILEPSPDMDPFFGASKVFDLTKPEAVDWIVELVSKKITEVGADGIWSDFCFEDPLNYWRYGEAEDRQGMREILYVMGFYRHWDELLRRHPDLGIINCAGGGRMIDLELMKRSVPLWTSDLMCFPDVTPTAGQCHTFGSLFWLPVSGTGCMQPDTYSWRSNMRSTAMARWWLLGKIPDDFSVDWLAKMLDQHQAIRAFYEGDYYPLTPYSRSETDWMAYQLHRSDMDAGVVVAFRRSESPDETARFKLHGLAPDGRYAITNFDQPGTTDMLGRELSEQGLPVALIEQASSAIITYQRSR